MMDISPLAKTIVFLFLLLVGATYIFVAAFVAGTLGVNEGFQDLLIIIAFLSPSPMQTGGGTVVHNYQQGGSPGVEVSPQPRPQPLT